MQKKRYAGILAAVFFVLLQAVFLTGCGGEGGANVTSLSLDKNGSVTSTIVEPFDKAYYEAESLQAMIQEEITAYGGGESVTLKSVEVSDANVVVTMEYASCEDYAAFNETALFYGTVAEAKDAGYAFDKEFTDANVDLTAMSDKHVLVIEENIQVYLPAKVAFMTAGVELVNSKCINTTNSDGLVYVIMK